MLCSSVAQSLTGFLSYSTPQAHGKIKAPSGSTFTSIDVGTKGEQIATYWTQKPDEAKATNAYIMIHGKLRDGDAVSGTRQGVRRATACSPLPSAVLDHHGWHSHVGDCGQRRRGNQRIDHCCSRILLRKIQLWCECRGALALPSSLTHIPSR